MNANGTPGSSKTAAGIVDVETTGAPAGRDCGKTRLTTIQPAQSMQPTLKPRAEPGSFRDRQGRIYYQGEAVYRTLSEAALSQWETLSQTRFYKRFSDDERIIPTEKTTVSEAEIGDGWAAVLRHRRIPFVSYPYEWPFSMLRDAALLHLDLTLAALDERMILKDASAYNVQWFGASPTFIDVASFETWREGSAWAGYRQFCQLFLYPLFLQAYKNLPYHAWLRGNIEGIEPFECAQVMSFRDLFRSGVLTHVYLQSKLQRRYADSDRDARSELSRAGFNKALIKNNLQKLRKVVDGLSWRESRSAWSSYAADNTYTDQDHQAKADFVKQAAAQRRRTLVWDLGSNTGLFSQLAAEHAEYVVSMDADHLTVELHYRRLREAGERKILPLVNNLADPSPDLGWRCLERKSLVHRGRPDFVLCLALIHHMVISANIPLREFILWLAELGGSLVIEFVAKNDPMVKKLLRNKEDQYDDYELGLFESALAENFIVRTRLPLQSGTRVLYHCDPRK